MQGDEVDSGHARLGDHDAPHRLLELLVGGGEGQALLDGRVLHDGLLDLEGRDGLAAAVDDLLGTTRDEQVALRVVERWGVRGYLGERK